MKRRFKIDKDLPLNTPLYRYVTIESFMSCVETKQFPLTKANLWEDPWEMFLQKVPLVDDRGKRISGPGYSIHEDVYGQCWSRVKESDAMWRIYSPSKTGVQIATSAEKFTAIDGIEDCYLGNVIYFESTSDLLERARANFHRRWLDFALYKRMAFSHECEVRLLTCRHLPTRPAYVTLSIDPSTFIESVTLDPRANDWYVNAVAKYCERVGLAATPVRSNLYEPDPHLKAGVARRWIPVKKNTEP